MFLKRVLVSIILAAGALLSILYWWSLIQPVILVDALTDHLSCVSYSPFHRPGQTPFDRETSISTEQIEADLTALAQRFDCVRTYSVTQGMQEVPRLAQKLGIKVLLGIWIGREQSSNEKELTIAIDLAQKYPSVIRAIIVGNEVLLRREQPPSMMRAYIERVKAAVPGVPVTYADVWEFWLRYQKDLLDSVSFATVHILPYWEDDPIGIENAVGHVSHIYQHTKAELKGKEVLIGETGWPSYGRQRQEAEPSLVNQARFIREFALRAELEKIPYNVIEAFDQPWKRDSEGAVGGYWGIYAADGITKFPIRGPVAEAPYWSFAAYGTMVAFLCLLVIIQLRARKLDGGTFPALLAISISSGGAWAGFCRDMVMTNRTPLEWAYTGLYAALLLAATFVLGSPLAAWCSTGETVPAMSTASHLVRWFRRNDQSFDKTARLLGALRFVFLFGAALVCVCLVFDLRSRDFPVALFSVPAIGLALLAWIKGKSEADLEEVLLAGWVGFAGLWIAVAEHIIIVQDEPWRLADGINQHAIAWAVLCLTLAGSVLGPVVVELRASQRQNA